MRLIVGVVLSALAVYQVQAYLKVQGTHLYYNSTQVFLSGANIAWFNYARDFGSGAYASVKSNYEKAIDSIAANGGNSMRVWVHIDGQWSPKFDSTGHATGEDTASLISDLGSMLDHAATKNVMVILCLWNLAVAPQQMVHLYTDEAKLQTYLDKVLKPMAAGLKSKPALAAYDIINEPIGGLDFNVDDANPCYNTTNLKGSGANWANVNLKAKDVLKFINLHADTIKAADSKALVTVGESSEQTATTICSTCRDYYTDHCLTGAGGKAKGVLDFYQLHSYTWQDKYSATSPFKKTFADFKNSKPIVVGEFSTSGSESKDPVKNYQYLYDNGYAGALDWMYTGGDDDSANANKGMNAIKSETKNGHIAIKL